MPCETVSDHGAWMCENRSMDWKRDASDGDACLFSLTEVRAEQVDKDSSIAMSDPVRA